jgi:hypothetical protein
MNHARRPGRWLVAIGLASLLAPAVAEAQTRRLAIVVGNNDGVGLRPPLRFAETDAFKLQRVLVDLGGFAGGDVQLLRGSRVAEVQRAFAAVRTRAEAARRDQGGKVVLLFYFSGHSDGEALELGRERLPFGDLRRWLAEAGADVRLAIVDSCKSGAMLGVKGGAQGPSFEIRFTDELASSGEAVLTSSAANELALESREVGASFFSHHLMSGLRGAADSSGDGQVTLAEAYRYAFTHTLVATANTLSGPQHPAYDYRLSGQGELVLTEVARRSALLVLPPGSDRILVEDTAQGQVLAEVRAGSARRLALPPGTYRLHGRRAGRPVQGTAVLREGQEQTVTAADLREVALAFSLAKGTDADPAATLSTAPGDAAGDRAGGRLRGSGLFLGGGLGGGVGRGLTVSPTLRLGLRAVERPGWRLTLHGSSVRGDGFRESGAALGLGYGLTLAGAHLRGALSAELTGGAMVQTIERAPDLWTPLLGATAAAEGGVRLWENTWLMVEAALAAALLRRDGELILTRLPSVTVGLLVALP